MRSWPRVKIHQTAADLPESGHAETTHRRTPSMIYGPACPHYRGRPEIVLDRSLKLYRY